MTFKEILGERDWENHGITSRNREPMHAPLQGSSQISLNGDWDFHLFDRIEDVPEDFMNPDTDLPQSVKLTVPGNWELQLPGTSDKEKPVYTNVMYPFSPKLGQQHILANPGRAPEEGNDFSGGAPLPPLVPEENAVGCYKTDFILDSSWMKQSLFLEFGGVESAFYLWVNGEFAGYSQDSKLPAEFDVTDYCREGSNVIALLVFRWCDGTWLEDQDYWHLSGIHRPVRLYGKPANRIRDYRIETVLDNLTSDTGSVRGAESARVLVDASTNMREGFAALIFKGELFDGNGSLVASSKGGISGETPMYRRSPRRLERGWANLSFEVPRPKLWDPENPSLYRLVLTLLSPGGKEIDREETRLGIREVKIDERGVLRLNGRRLIVRGVDRHEHCVDTGRVVSREHMIREIIQMKRLGFNAVRTSHYPNSTAWYDLCDEMGICLVNEANLETHGVGSLLSKDPEWAQAYLERAVRMVLRDRNHPSVIIWSLGNESGAAWNHASIAAWIRNMDPTRPVQYESGDPARDISDIRVPMYPGLDWVRDVMADETDLRPFIMCEYAYAKSNSNGNLFKYWDMVEKYPRFQGGFVWDWSDKALWATTDEGQRYWAYGGDFGEEVTNYMSLDMCLNGVVQPDLSWHPGAYELKNVQAALKLSPAGKRHFFDSEPADPEEFLLQNRFQSTRADEFLLSWELLGDGTPFATGELALPPVLPGEDEPIIIPWKKKLAGEMKRAEYHLHLFIKRKTGCFWAPEGYEIYRSQRDVTGDVRRSFPTTPFPTAPSYALGLNKKDPLSLFKVEDFSLALFRPTTGIDRGQKDANSYAFDWYDDGLDKIGEGKNESPENGMSVTRYKDDKDREAGILTRRWKTDGATLDIDFTLEISPRFETLPRIGVSLTLPAEYTGLEWFGRGPWENYADRKSAALERMWNSTVNDQYYDFILPVETGGKEDVRWLTLEDPKGKSRLHIGGKQKFHFNVLPWSTDQIEKARHFHELPEPSGVHLNLDVIHSGLGGDTGWTKNIHPEYQVRPGTYRFGFIIGLEKL